MKLYTIPLCVLLAFSSCEESLPEPYIPHELEPYVEQVIYLSEIHDNPLDLRGLTFQVAELDMYAGWYEDGRITIDTDLIEKGNKWHIHSTIAHEIGHWLGRAHNNEMLGSRAITLMHEQHLLHCKLEDSWYYWYEFFIINGDNKNSYGSVPPTKDHSDHGKAI